MQTQQIDFDTAQARIRDTLIAHQRDRALDVLLRLAPVEAAGLLQGLPSPELAGLVSLLGEAALASILENVDAGAAARLMLQLSRAQAADILEEMGPDDATDVMAEFTPEQQSAILVEMTAPEARDIRDLLAYPPESAGGRMTPDVVTVDPDLTVDDALAAIRRVAEEAETIYYVYVTDAGRHLLGVLNMRDLVLARPGTPVTAVMVSNPVRVRADADQEVAVRLLSERGFLAIPVVDADDRLLGIITADDAMQVLQEEFSEDYLGLAGTDAAAMERRTPFQVARMRLPWLLGTMAIELCAGLVIARFDQVLQQVILLASFMPVISAVSGNVGLQAAAIVVRGLDTGHVQLRHWGHQVVRELATSFLMALACGAVLGSVGVIWSGHPSFGAVIGCAMTCSILTAGFMGSVIPILSKRLGFDPATTAGPFETAFQDVIGFAVFLWLAGQLLQWLQ